MVAQGLAIALLGIWLHQPVVISGQLIILGTEGDPINFPWLCRIVLRGEPPFTMCSLFHKNYAFTSADNWNKKSAIRKPGMPFYKVLAKHGAGGFAVVANKEIDARDVPAARLIRLWLPTNPKIVNSSGVEAQSMVALMPDNLQDDAFDATGGFAMGVALVQMMGVLDVGNHPWTYEMLPLPLPSTSITKIEKDLNFWKPKLEEDPHSHTSCTAGTLREMPAGWDPMQEPGKPSVIYHQLTYIPLSDCRAAYCAAEMNLCMNFPADSHLVCFKPNTYTDFCDYDRGISLWCPWFESSVFAILTHTDSCGYRRLPSIYTLINGPLRLFAAATRQKDLTIPERPEYSNYKFIIPLPPGPGGK